jgi:hypothetical protein
LKYLLGMDNYFTQPVVIGMTRRMNVGLIGTARWQRNCPLPPNRNTKKLPTGDIFMQEA